MVRPALQRSLVWRPHRRDGGVPGHGRRSGAFLEGEKDIPCRAHVRRRRHPVCLLHLRDALLRQRRHAPSGRPSGRSPARGGRAGRSTRAPAVGAGEALRRSGCDAIGERLGSGSRRSVPDSPAPRETPVDRSLATGRRGLRRRSRRLAAQILRPLFRGGLGQEV